MAISDSAALDQEFEKYLIEEFVDPLVAKAILAQFTHPSAAVPRGAKTARWPLINSIASSHSPATEGTTPGTTTLSDATFEATLEQLIVVVEISDVVDTQSMSGTAEQIMMLLRDCASRSYDEYIQIKSHVTTTVIIAGTTASTLDIDGTFDTATLRTLHKKFVNNNVTEVPPNAVAPYFPLILHTVPESELLADAAQTFTTFTEFLARAGGTSPTGGSLWENTPGALHGISVKASNNILTGTTTISFANATYATTSDAYNNLSLGRWGLGVLRFEDMIPRDEMPLLVSDRVPTESDPAAQRKSFAFKLNVAGTVIQNAAVIGVPSFK